MEKELFYNDDTKLKDLTVGQLKDLIIEVLSHGVFTRFEPEKRTHQYEPGYIVRPSNEPNPYRPAHEVWCESKGEIC